MTKFVRSFHIILRERDWAEHSAKYVYQKKKRLITLYGIIPLNCKLSQFQSLPEDLTRMKQGITERRTKPPTDKNGSLNPPS